MIKRLRKDWPVLLVVAAISLSLANMTSASAQECFKAFDATKFSGKPDMEKLGFHRILVKNALDWWDPNEAKDQLTTSHKLELWAANHTDPSLVLALDLEHWPTRGDPVEVSKTVSRLMEIIRRLRAAGFTGMIGYYGLLPNRDYWRAIKDPSGDAYKSWQRENDQLSPLVGAVDILFPSLYTFYKDPAGWRVYAEANISEAKRLSNGKPVVPFLWPRLHESVDETSGLPIEPAVWQDELDLVASRADGVVIWSEWGRQGPQPWNESAPWWPATKNFVSVKTQQCLSRTPKPPEEVNAR